MVQTAMQLAQQIISLLQEQNKLIGEFLNIKERLDRLEALEGRLQNLPEYVEFIKGYNAAGYQD